MTKNDKLTPPKRRAIAALMTSRDVRSAAREAGVSERTLHRWIDDPAFLAELKAAEGALIDQAVRRLAEIAGSAIETLAAVISNAETPAGVRVQAASVALSHVIRLRELADFEKRLSALEAAARTGQGGS